MREHLTVVSDSAASGKTKNKLRVGMSEDAEEARSVVREDSICGGAPILEGTRIRISDVEAQVARHDKTPEEVVSSFPALAVSDACAALAYYDEGPSQIRREIRERGELLARKAQDGK